MSYLNVDFDFFDHPKTRRLRALLGHGSETTIMRLWAHCGKFHPDDGILAEYSVAELEEICGWHGEAGKAVEALQTVRFLEQCSSNATALRVHDWSDHQGHISMLKVRAKAAAAARWGNTPKIDAQAMLKHESSTCSSNASRGNGTEYTEGSVPVPERGNGGKPDHYHKDTRAALHILNEASGAHFRECDSHLTVISARLNESEVTIDGVRLMILRQCKRWKGTTQADYLRPETLFGKSKFDNYYAARELPVSEDSKNSRPGSVSASRGTANEGRAASYANAKAIKRPVASDDKAVSDVSGPGA